MKPEYYIYSWKTGAFRSCELSKSLKGYSHRGTAERAAKVQFDGVHDRIRYCVALTDEEAFAEMTRRNLPNAYFDTDDAERCYKCGQLRSTCITNYYDGDGNIYRTDRCAAVEWRNPNEKDI